MEIDGSSFSSFSLPPFSPGPGLGNWHLPRKHVRTTVGFFPPPLFPPFPSSLPYLINLSPKGAKRGRMKRYSEGISSSPLLSLPTPSGAGGAPGTEKMHQHTEQWQPSPPFPPPFHLLPCEVEKENGKQGRLFLPFLGGPSEKGKTWKS